MSILFNQLSTQNTQKQYAIINSYLRLTALHRNFKQQK